MDDLLYLLAFVFFFVILPMLQRARRKGQVPQPSRRPQRAGGRDSPSGPPSYDEDPSYDDEAIRSSSSPQPAQQRSAEDVLPDDLWQILTGERRPRSRTEPEPQREEAPSPYDEVGADTEPVESDYEPSYTGDAGAERERDERVREWEGVSWEPEPQPIPVPVPLPRPVQLPDPGRAARARARTHPPGAGPEVEAATSRGGRRLNIALNLDTRDELRRAMILREVLGPPKGLE